MKGCHHATHIDTKLTETVEVFCTDHLSWTQSPWELILDRSIFTPDEQKFWPEQDNLDWHRKKRFRS